MKYLILLLVFILNAEANPVHFQTDQLDYTVFSNGNPASSENLLRYFHELFLKLHGRIFEESGAKRNYPVKIYLYSSPGEFEKYTRQKSFTAGFYLKENRSYHFLLTPKTTGNQKVLESLLSHELCHGAVDSLGPILDKAFIPLEEGFCYYNYPPAYGSSSKKKFNKNNYKDFNDFLEKNRILLSSGTKKQRESAFTELSFFIAHIQKHNGKQYLLRLLSENSSEQWKLHWNRM